MDGKIEGPAFHVEERHLDGRLRLETIRDLAIHEGERAMEIEGVAAEECRGDLRDGVVDVGRGHERVARRRIHIAPPFDAFVRGDTYENAARHGGRAVDTADRTG